MTLLKELEEIEAMSRKKSNSEGNFENDGKTSSKEAVFDGSADAGGAHITDHDQYNNDQQRPTPPVYYIWESVLVGFATFCLAFNVKVISGLIRLIHY